MKKIEELQNANKKKNRFSTLEVKNSKNTSKVLHRFAKLWSIYVDL